MLENELVLKMNWYFNEKLDADYFRELKG